MAQLLHRKRLEAIFLIVLALLITVVFYRIVEPFIITIFLAAISTVCQFTPKSLPSVFHNRDPFRLRSPFARRSVFARSRSSRNRHHNLRR